MSRSRIMTARQLELSIGLTVQIIPQHVIFRISAGWSFKESYRWENTVGSVLGHTPDATLINKLKKYRVLQLLS